MAFDRLQSLGAGKFRTVVEKLLGGTRENSVAKMIQKQWGDCQDVLENTLVEELKALHEAASKETRENGHVTGEDNRTLQLRDSELGCLEKLIRDAIATEDCIDSLAKNGRLTDSEDRIAIPLIKLHMKLIAMIHDLKLDLGLDAYKRGMSAEEIDASDRYEFDEKMRWIDAERRVDKWLERSNIIGADKEDFLNRYHAKYGERQEDRAHGESASSSSSPPAAMSDKVPQEQADEAILAAGWDALEQLKSYPKRPWQ